jgi:hypothetical protein
MIEKFARTRGLPQSKLPDLNRTSKVLILVSRLRSSPVLNCGVPSELRNHKGH